MPQPLATDIKVKAVIFFGRPGASVLKLYLGYVEVEFMRHVAALVDALLKRAGVGAVNLKGEQVRAQLALLYSVYVCHIRC